MAGGERHCSPLAVHPPCSLCAGVSVDWLKIFFVVLSRVPAKIAALFIVPFLSPRARVEHPIFGVRDAKDLGWKNIAFRNGAHNFLSRPNADFYLAGGQEIDESKPGYQWRYRRTVDGEYRSIRLVWGNPDPKSGKKEFYFGWVPNKKSGYMRPSIQLRPF